MREHALALPCFVSGASLTDIEDLGMVFCFLLRGIHLSFLQTHYEGHVRGLPSSASVYRASVPEGVGTFLLGPLTSGNIPEVQSRRQRGLWVPGALPFLVNFPPPSLFMWPPAQDIKPGNPWENQSLNPGSLDLCVIWLPGREIHEHDNPPGTTLTLCGHQEGFPRGLVTPHGWHRKGAYG